MKLDLIRQLVHFYYHFDYAEGVLLEEPEIRNTIQNLLNKNRISVVTDSSGFLLGYLECWRINFEQLGRIICQQKFDVGKEDIQSGKIAYVANITIHPEFRSNGIIEHLKEDFYENNLDADFFIGESRRKKHAPLAVFTKSRFKRFIERSKRNGRL